MKKMEKKANAGLIQKDKNMRAFGAKDKPHLFFKPTWQTLSQFVGHSGLDSIVVSLFKNIRE